MRRLTYLIGVTVDGFIAGPGDEIDFFPTPEPYLAHLATEYPETMPTHVRAALGIADAPNRRWDTVVMGRGTLSRLWRWASPARTRICASSWSPAPSPLTTRPWRSSRPIRSAGSGT